MKFHRRRTVQLEVKLDQPFPEPPPKKPPINILQQALTVKSYIAEHPKETCLSASSKINVHRKRIAKLKLHQIAQLDTKTEICSKFQVLNQESTNTTKQ